MSGRGIAKSPREIRAEAEAMKRDADWKKATGYKHKPGAGRPSNQHNSVEMPAAIGRTILAEAAE